MPTRVVVVHENRDFAATLARGLTAAGHSTTIFPDPLVAMASLKGAKTVRLLITGIEFPSGKSNGLSMALVTRQSVRDVKVIFVGDSGFQQDLAWVGEVLDPADVLEASLRLLS